MFFSVLPGTRGKLCCLVLALVCESFISVHPAISKSNMFYNSM